MNRLDGFEVPVHRSLTEPMLIAGLPRTTALLLWVGTAAFVLGLRQIWMLLPGIGLHVAFALVTRADPHFFDLVVPSIKLPRRLDP